MDTIIKPTNHPFLFFGAGKITRQGWGRSQTYIKFVEPLTPENIEKVDSIDESGIVSTYGDDGGKYKTDSHIIELLCTDDMFERDSWDADRNAAFDKTLEEWLIAVHEVCPIETVTRNDVEGEFSTWHSDSLKCAAKLLEKWKTECRTGKYQISDAMETMGSDVIKAMKDAGMKPKYKYDNLFADASQPKEEIPDEDYDLMEFSVLSNRCNVGFNRVLTLEVTLGLTALLDYWREKGMPKDERRDVSIRFNPEKGDMEFCFGVKKCVGEPFFVYHIGNNLAKCCYMEKLLRTKFDSTWNYFGIAFDNALNGIAPEKYANLDIAVWKPDMPKRKSPMIGKA